MIGFSKLTGDPLAILTEKWKIQGVAENDAYKAGHSKSFQKMSGLLGRR